MSDGGAATGRADKRARLSRVPVDRFDVVLALVVLLLTAPVLSDRSSQVAARYALTAAVWDHHTVRIDAERGILGSDVSQYRGHLYSDKAPLQPLLAVPFYAVYRLFGGRSAEHSDSRGDPGVWWITLWSSTVPAIVLVLMMRRGAGRIDARAGPPVALVLAAATMLFPFAAMLFGHVLATALVYGGWLVADGDREPTASRMCLAGGLCGAALATEFQIAVLVAVIAGAVTVRDRRSLVPFVAGIVPFVVLIGLYQLVAFGNPLHVSLQSHVLAKVHRGFFSIGVPKWRDIVRVLFGDRGFLVATPVLLFGVVGLASLARRRTADVVLAASGLVALVVVEAGIDVYGGAAPGPRYMIPVIPFLAGPLASVWRRSPRVVEVAGVLGFAVMGLALATNPIVGSVVPNGIGWWWDFARAGQWAPTWLTRTTPKGWPFAIFDGLAFVAAWRWVILPARVPVPTDET